jgi:hypothetical protein
MENDGLHRRPHSTERGNHLAQTRTRHGRSATPSGGP